MIHYIVQILILLSKYLNLCVQYGELFLLLIPRLLCADSVSENLLLLLSKCLAISELLLPLLDFVI